MKNHNQIRMMMIQILIIIKKNKFKQNLSKKNEEEKLLHKIKELFMPLHVI